MQLFNLLLLPPLSWDHLVPIIVHILIRLPQRLLRHVHRPPNLLKTPLVRAQLTNHKYSHPSNGLRVLPLNDLQPSYILRRLLTPIVHILSQLQLIASLLSYPMRLRLHLRLRNYLLYLLITTRQLPLGSLSYMKNSPYTLWIVRLPRCDKYNS